MSLSGESTASSVPSSLSSSAELRRRPAVADAPGKMHDTLEPSTRSSSPPPLPSSSSPQQSREEEATASTASAGWDGAPPPSPPPPSSSPLSWTARNQWIVYAIASGGCAAFNGVFAKLTTNGLTTHIARGISGVLGLTASQGVIEVVVRCIFFGLNIVFNGVMWTLFTQALSKGHSTTQVSIMNTSTNFMITALLGLAIFAESLPPLWWLGAAMLVAGNVIVGRKGEGTSPGGDEVTGDSRDRLLGSTAPEAGDSSLRQGYGTLPQDEDGRKEDEDATTAAIAAHS
ncbi:hypothetical protein SLS62_003984 [Diatrype stigma]|uniref:Transmembrane protein 42 n=1 Tax=Diatrype stigma TaxID=117547 RepID=A0AAN9UU88_9PEZI